MIDSLILQERIKNTISLGESHFREFKSAFDGEIGNKKSGNVKKLCQYIGEALVAFANADGGDLLIGVEDNGEVTGVPHGEVEIKNMLSAHKTHIFANNTLPLLSAQRVELENKIVLFFSVDKGSVEIYQLPDGRCVRRKDKNTEPVKFEQIKFERQEVKSRQYDRQFVDGATVNDLDLSLLRSISDSYIKGLSVERYLQQIGLAEYGLNGLRLRMAALLLFAQDIQRWHPRSQVRILQVSGSELRSGENYNVISDETTTGNIFELLERSWEQLRPYLAYKTEFGSDAKFEQKYIYPELACREALINAIAHRDYSIQNGIDIFVFSNSLQIRSPGALLSTLTIKSLEKLENAHESRNASITRVLRENRYVRELGEGMQRMFDLMNQRELRQPILYSNGLWFSVTFSHESIFSPRQQEWLSLFQSFNLSPRQKRIVLLGMDNREISKKEIEHALNTKELRVYTDEITVLRNKKILEEIMTNPSAAKYAKSKNMPKDEVKRFKVRVP
ncbi:putative DNA binding domain-containing protein [Pseudanabaena sp. FACHB-1277]|uniref:DNA binding domain-containing protein n=1 Tax=Pseudanabaena cinerea FACHB-1277 TaxID=2949581 RepID=A0A926UV53_9CYAN|nr:ATP-binding protein [Pseudanabaena cinerea]MBD2151841.1 putative DNA binding domain-containing protein [Pseudanabaena cinerea FACHB-1277]